MSKYSDWPLAADVSSGSARSARFRDVLALVAEVGKGVDPFRAAVRIPHFVLLDHAFCVRDVSSQLNVGRQTRQP